MFEELPRQNLSGWLFVTLKPPYKAIGAGTVSAMLRQTLSDAGLADRYTHGTFVLLGPLRLFGQVVTQRSHDKLGVGKQEKCSMNIMCILDRLNQCLTKLLVFRVFD